MSESIETVLARYPDVSFIDGKTLAGVKSEMLKDYKAKYLELTGRETTIGEADPIRLMLDACAYQIYQGFAYIDRAGKNGLLKYSRGDWLDNLAMLRGISRNDAKAAVTTIRFYVSEPRTFNVAIPSGTRVTNGEIYFQTDEYGEIPAGGEYADVMATCTTTGESGNGIEIGEINAMADPLAYIKKVSNLTVTSGGADVESDDSLLMRAYLAPEHYSVAGSTLAYEYWVQYYQDNIADVKVTSPSDGVVDIRVLMEDGLPSDDICKSILTKLSADRIRPLTDKVEVKAPDTAEMQINVKYYINESDASIAGTIQSQVNSAIEKYKKWQTTKIGRDINPSVLIQYITAAGAKRVEVTSPVFTKVSSTTAAVITDTTVEYGGIEDD